MKTRTIRTMTALMLGLALGAGCKKKEQDQPGPATGGSAPAPAEGSAPAPPPAPPTPKTGADLAQAYLDCAKLISAARWDDFGQQCLAPGFAGHQAGDEDVPRDKLLARLAGAKVAFPDLQVEPQLVLVSGRTVIAVELMRGTNAGPLEGEAGRLEPTQKKFGVLMYERLAIDDANRATEQWAYVDPATMIGQLGQRPKELPPVRPAMEQGLPGAPIVVVAAADDKEQANLEVVKKHNDAFNARKAADVMAVFADDAMEADQGAGADIKGKQHLAQALAGLWKAFPDARIEVPSLWTAGDYVAAEGKLTGTHSGPLGKLPKTGKKIEMAFAEIFKVKDGKITEMWRFWNQADMAKQLGIAAPAKKM